MRSTSRSTTRYPSSRISSGPSSSRSGLPVSIEAVCDLVEVIEALELDAALAQVAGETTRREDAVSELGGAAIGVAVAHVDELTAAAEVFRDRALAGLAARVAVVAVAPLDAPAVRPSVDAVRDELDRDALAALAEEPARR
jgi:hypothetical protein